MQAKLFTRLALSTLFAAMLCFSAVAQQPAPQHSSTGPLPPPQVQSKALTAPSQAGGASVVLDVPGYAWRHGCGPTAVGMVLGYWDANGFPDLFSGDASSQTSVVNQGIASQGSGTTASGTQLHYEDYSLPMDTSSLIADRSQTNPGGVHADNSIADFMRTSFSVDGMQYGWSYSSGIEPAFTEYVEMKNATYTPTVNFYYYGSGQLTFDVLKNEIDSGRPMVFLVDSSGNGSTDHFVTIVGYDDGTPRQYACLDTWAPVDTVRWCEFRGLASGDSWGIWGGWSFELEAANDYSQYYDIFYHNPYSSVQPQLLSDRILITDNAGPGVLKIYKKPGYLSYPQIPSVHVDGSLSLYYGRADVGELLVTGDLARCYSVDSHIGEIVGPNIGIVKMRDTATSQSSEGAEESMTRIFSGYAPTLSDPPAVEEGRMEQAPATGGAASYFLSQTQLVGVGMDYFSAWQQEATIIMSPKKHLWYDGAFPVMDISWARIPYVHNTDSDTYNYIEANYLRRLLVMGGGDSRFIENAGAIEAYEVVSTTNVPDYIETTIIQTRHFLGTTYSIHDGRQVVELSGRLYPLYVDAHSDYLKMAAFYGDLLSNDILVDGAIPLLRALRGQIIISYSVQTGFDQTFAYPDINVIAGDFGVMGHFMAGVSALDTPDYSGLVGTIHVNKNLYSLATINGTAYVYADIIRFLGDTAAKSAGRFTVYTSP